MTSSTRSAAPRLGPLPVAQWSEQDRETLRGSFARADRYLSGDADAPPMPPILGLLARHSRVGGPWLAFNGRLLDAGTLDPRDRELLILRVASRTGCRYLWAEHVGLARSAGLTRERTAAVTEGPEAAGWAERDRDLLRATDQLVADHALDDALWARLASFLDERQLLEAIFVVGSYTCLAMVLNSVGLEPATKPVP
ncbi:alkylhydroperoxidase AhpD family core domain-containing protein [Parafrankia irregularis]|uniref:Alkylhydroperoxidase AhpD family core domain-containing protein n=1 Tax=Parafrankia irregularis TaxID=795642 RepID=A0A0S4QN74_9ACTN|nr:MULTISPECIES: carboxymuconolactone decarboxylase family protein [Parafrankia]MBE3206030.1 carboxymuconolactone decarboxylase family protein [Parafrankia sp. CH37]CUU57089.1 alkylhydroperoxidase AhpD family core domain-containing protein [Parafrankia irregularis]